MLIDARRRLLIDCSLFLNAEAPAEGKFAAECLAIEFAMDTIKALVANG